MTIAANWNRLIERWRRSNLTIRSGVSPEAITAFEAKYEVVLPTDVREYFTVVDGTGDDLDNEMYRFLPLAEVKPVHEHLADTEHFSYLDRFAYPNCFVFADYCISCWFYAVKITSDPTQPAPVFYVTGRDPHGKQMASSFREFMERYAANPNNVLI
ncbi:MAG: SMI1/KNR4 family protein [Planctomycetota bacterium]